MEAQDGLDELFRNKLEEGHAPVPSFSWDAIQEKVALEKEKKNKKTAFPFIWMAASFVTGILASGLFFYQHRLETENEYWKELALQNNREQSTIPEHLPSKKPANLSLSTPEMAPKSTDEHTTIERKNRESTNRLTSSTHSTYSFSVSSLTAQNSTSTKKEKEKASSLSIMPSQNGKQQSIKSEENLVSSPRRKSTLLTTPQTHLSSLAQDVQEKGSTRHKKTLYLAFEENKAKQRELLSTASTKQRVTVSKNNLSTSSFLPTENEDVLSTAQTAPLASSYMEDSANNEPNKTVFSQINKDSLSVAVLDSLPKKDTDIKKPIKEKEKAKKEPRLFGLPVTLGVYVAPEWASRTLKFSGNEDPELVSYKKNDQHKFGFSAGISLDLKLPERFYLRTGLNYWNVGDQNHTVLKSQPTKPSPTKIGPEKTTNPNTWGPIPKDTLGFGPTITNDISLSSLSKEFSSRTKNNYHYLGIPALLGMKLGRSKLSAGIYSGLLVNVLLSPSRSVYYVYYDAQNPDQYTESYRELSRFSLTYWGGIDVDYKLSKNWTVNLSPNVKYSLTALYKDRETVRQLPYSFGIQVGCKYSF